VSREELAATLAQARTLLSAGDPVPADRVAALLLEILRAAEDTAEVLETLRDVPAGRALLRLTDGTEAIEFRAGEGRLHAEAAQPRGRGPKVDATSATWLGLLGGTLRPWLAFTRGLVVCRAGLTELRWMQQVAERLQRGYEAAQAASR
jgi:hypothetical protein